MSAKLGFIIMLLWVSVHVHGSDKLTEDAGAALLAFYSNELEADHWAVLYEGKHVIDGEGVGLSATGFKGFTAIGKEGEIRTYRSIKPLGKGISKRLSMLQSQSRFFVVAGMSFGAQLEELNKAEDRDRFDRRFDVYPFAIPFSTPQGCEAGDESILKKRNPLSLTDAVDIRRTSIGRRPDSGIAITFEISRQHRFYRTVFFDKQLDWMPVRSIFGHLKSEADLHAYEFPFDKLTRGCETHTEWQKFGDVYFPIETQMERTGFYSSDREFIEIHFKPIDPTKLPTDFFSSDRLESDHNRSEMLDALETLVSGQ